VSQSTVLAGALIAGFVVYLAMNNRLQTYWQILLGSGAGGVAPPGTLSKSPIPGFETGVAPGSGGIPGFSAPP
jgi:hypothetical protein